MGAIEPPVFNTYGLPHHVAFSWVVMVLLISLGLAAARKPALIPSGLQNAMEAVLEFILSLIDDVIGREGRRFFPLIATLGLYIFTSNLFGLLPGFSAPTDNVNTTASCAVVVFFAYHWIGIRKHGLWPYLKHFAGPVPWLAPLMIPIELISHLARPLSLSVRLFGNMMGGHILLSIVFFMTVGLSTWALSGAAGLLGVLIGAFGTVATIAFTVGFLFPLKLLVAFLQAFIFCMLSMLYIAGALEVEHGHEPTRGHEPRGAEATAHHWVAASRPEREKGGAHVRIVLVILVLAVVLTGEVAVAQAAAPAGEGGAALLLPFAALAAGLGMAVAAGLCGLGQGRAIASALEAIARQPGAAARIQTAMIIGLALIESLAIYMLVIAIILLFVKPGL